MKAKEFFQTWLPWPPLKAFTSRIPILSYFTIPKDHFINYTIPFYNTSNIPKVYYFTFLLKYYFLSPKGKHKKHFFLFVLSFLSFLPLSLSYLTSLLLIWVWLCSGSCLWDHGSVLRLWIVGLCSDCGSWVVDREFVIWVFVGCDPVGFY